MEPSLKRRRLEEAKRDLAFGQHYAGLRDAGAQLEQLCERLACMEDELAGSLQSCTEPDAKQKFKQLRSRMEATIREELSRLCGLACEPAEVAEKLGCCVLQATTTRGRDVICHNQDYNLQNHIDMVSDKVRVSAFQSSIYRSAKGKRVLDVGTGAFCLLARMALAAGAARVDAVEINEWVCGHAEKLLRREATMKNQENEEGLQLDADLSLTAKLLPEVPPLAQPGAQVCEDTSGVSPDNSGKPCCTISVIRGNLPSSRLCLYSGSLQKSPLSGPYELVVHELLGHVASSEGVVETLKTLQRPDFCAKDCTFIPCAAGTLFAPTSKLELASSLERVLHCFFNAGTRIEAQTKYHARCFDATKLLARPRFFEYLTFSAVSTPDAGRRRVVFITDMSGEFDGLHFHLHVQLDESTEIDTLATRTTWSTTYVKLLERGVWLPEGSRIVCDCISGTKAGSTRGMPYYSVTVSIGEPWDEKKVASFCWEGAT